MRGQISSSEFPVIPKPVSVNFLKGVTTLDSKSVIFYTDRQLQSTAELLSEVFKGSGFAAPKLVFTNNALQPKGIILTLDNSIAEEEGYRLTSEKVVVIAGKTPRGVFYGVQTLYQLMFANQTTKGYAVPSLQIADYPRFPWRGMHLDVSRHFFSKEFVKKFIDLIALHKMNTFHWHLVDDQGWRIEIKKYPKLTEVGAWRVDHEDMPWNNRPAQKPGEKATYGGYYTQDDIREIVAYASQRFITVIPEIEMPAHVTCAIAAYPQFSCKQQPITVPSGGFWPITDIYCAGNDSTFLFLQDVLTEVMDLFPSKYIHVGGDEADKTNWKTCPKCQARIKSEGLKNVGELQNYFISRIDKFLTSKGRTLVGWDEILEGGLADNATVMSWRGTDGGIHAARLNHDVVMTPTQYCYLDYYQSGNKEIEPPAFGGLVDYKLVYSFEPVPQALNSTEAKHVLGAQGNLWSEFLTTDSHTEYMALPRMAAMSEVLWTPADMKNEADFLRRMQYMYNIYSARGYNYHIPAPAGLIDTMIFIGSTKMELNNPFPFGQMRYTTDGSVPSSTSPVYNRPIDISSNTTVKAALFLDNGRSSAAKTGTFVSKAPEAPVVFASSPEKGIRFNYYEAALKSVNQIAGLTPVKTGTTFVIAIPEGYNKDEMAFTFDGFILVPATAVYTFKLISDDGSALLIDDKLVVNHDGPHGPEPREGQIALQKGYHRILVKYFEAGGGEIVKLMVKSPGMPEKEVDADMLYH
jgi:hexosaminidase